MGTHAGVPGHQPRIVSGRGEHVTDPEVAGLEPIAPGHPRKAEQRAGAGQQHDLIDRDVLRTRCPDDGDCPSPVGIRPICTGKEVCDDPLVVGLDTFVVADRRVPRDGLGGFAGKVDGGRAHCVGHGWVGVTRNRRAVTNRFHGDVERSVGHSP